MLVSEIELRGLLTHVIGLYRVNCSDSQVKQLKERLVKRHQPPDLRKINNILTEHLVTYDAWYRFAKACGKQSTTTKKQHILSCHFVFLLLSHF